MALVFAGRIQKTEPMRKSDHQRDENQAQDQGDCGHSNDRQDSQGLLLPRAFRATDRFIALEVRYQGRHQKVQRQHDRQDQQRKTVGQVF